VMFDVGAAGTYGRYISRGEAEELKGAGPRFVCWLPP